MAGSNNKIVEIEYDAKSLRRVEKMLQGIPNALPKVVSRAINRTASPAKSEISQGIREKINATAKRVNERINIIKATYNNWIATIHISRRRLPLMAFGAKQTAKGVSYKIKRNGSREFIPHAFIATMKSGHEGVFERDWMERLPITEKFGPSIGEQFRNLPSLIRRVTDSAYERLEHNIDSQIDYLLMRRGLRRAS